MTESITSENMEECSNTYLQIFWWSSTQHDVNNFQLETWRLNSAISTEVVQELRADRNVSEL